MARAPRVLGDGIHYHVILRCNNGEYLLQTESDYKQFISILSRLKAELMFKIYNYTLMHSHAHLILSTHQGYFLDEVMHRFCLKYAKDFNKRNDRTGHLWKNRYRAKIIFNDLHAIACLRYQHRNPDRACMVNSPEEWLWSGYSFYAYGKEDPFLTPHPAYIALSKDPALRQLRYRKFVEQPLTSAECRLFERRNFGASRRLQRELEKIILPRYQIVSGTI